MKIPLEAIAAEKLKGARLPTRKAKIMSKQKREKFTATATPEKICSEKPFVQVEGELTEAQLEAIAAGGPETSPRK